MKKKNVKMQILNCLLIIYKFRLYQFNHLPWSVLWITDGDIEAQRLS